MRTSPRTSKHTSRRRRTAPLCPPFSRFSRGGPHMRSAVGSGFRTCRTAVLLLILALATAVPVAAQGEASAAVTGVITDAQGGVLPGVTVTLRNVDSGTVRTTVTETEGQYRVAGLL